MRIRFYAVLLALALVLGLCACGGAAGSAPSASAQEASAPAELSQAEPVTEEAPAPEAEAPAPEAESTLEEPEPPAELEIEVSYPLTEEDITLDYMMLENSSVVPFLEGENYNNHLLLQAAEKITGVKINCIPVNAFTAAETYSLSFASGDLADMYYWGVMQYPKGADGAIEDDVFIRLNELIEEYAPNYKKAREVDDATMRDTISDEGNIVTFYVLNTESVYSGMGYLTRKDLLDQAGLDIPETYDDWYEMLTAYKNMGVEIPCYSLGDMDALLFGGFGIAYHWVSFVNVPFFQIDGEAQFSPLAEGYKPMLETFHKWYSEGLVLEDFYSLQNSAETQVKYCDGRTAVWACFPNAVNVFRDNTSIEGASVVPIPNPVRNKGDQIHIAPTQSLVGRDCGAISTQCEYPELAVQWMDFWYSPQGYELVNYGVEGVSFEYNDAGEREFTDVVLNNENGLAPDVISALYLGDTWPGLNDPAVEMSTYDEDQLNAMEVWGSNLDDTWNFPTGAALTSEETEEFNALYSDISTYISTEGISFITGARDLSTFDDFVETLKSMNTDRCIELKQAALDRYYSKALN